MFCVFCSLFFFLSFWYLYFPISLDVVFVSPVIFLFALNQSQFSPPVSLTFSPVPYQPRCLTPLRSLIVCSSLYMLAPHDVSISSVMFCVSPEVLCAFSAMAALRF